MYSNSKRLFFDSGMVLVYPRSGDWFYPVAYKEYCHTTGLPETSIREKINGLKAQHYLQENHLIETEAQEYDLFLGFYERLFSKIKGKDTRELIELCTKAKVQDYKKYLFYDDVRESMIKLSKNYKLGIITDAWPSIRNVYKTEMMDTYFDPFIISSIYGVTKSEIGLFYRALKGIEEKPEECIFVDDSMENCKIAQELGMNVLVLKRNEAEHEEKGMKVIGNLRELENVLGL